MKQLGQTQTRQLEQYMSILILCFGHIFTHGWDVTEGNPLKTVKFVGREVGLALLTFLQIGQAMEFLRPNNSFVHSKQHEWPHDKTFGKWLEPL